MKLLKDFLIYILVTLVCFLTLALLLRTPLFSGVLYFFRLFVFAFIAEIIVGVILGFIHNVSTSVKFAAIIISFLIMTIFFALGAAVIDRSYSVFSLAYLETFDKQYTAEEIENVFVEEYVRENAAVNKRIDEQVRCGNLVVFNGEEITYRISARGRFVVGVMRFLEWLFPVENKRNLYPDY